MKFMKEFLEYFKFRTAKLTKTQQKIIEIIPKKIIKSIQFTPITTNHTGNPIEPWFTRDSINIINQLLKKSFIGFEYGSGSSTIWLSRRISHLTSIEHNQKWYCEVKEKMIKKKIKNIDYKILSLKNDEYVNYIKRFPNDYFDLVVIDGRNRVKCIINSIEKVKPIGFIILDNSERKRYEEGKNLMKKWKNINTSNKKWETTIYFKPP